MIELMCKKCNGADHNSEPIKCDEDTISVTCGTCSMMDLIGHLENEIVGIA